VVGNYERGLDEIVALQPVRYTFKGNDTFGPPTMPPDPEAAPDIVPMEGTPTVPYWNSGHYSAATEGTEFVGMIAQAVEAVLPEMVTAADGYIDGEAVTDLRNLDTTPLIYALINSIKTMNASIQTLTTRIEALEAQP
jgi:hypothetical protein